MPKNKNILSDQKKPSPKKNEGDNELNDDLLSQANLKEILRKSEEEKRSLVTRIASLEKAQNIIFEQFRELELQRIDIEKQQALLKKSSQKFRERTIELFGKIIDLKKAKKTIALQKEEIENHRERLRESNASKDKFFSIVAHDLRNPIAGFLNLTEALSNNFEVLSEAESKEFIEVLHDSSKQLYNLLENLLQWSRAQTGNLRYEPKFLVLKKIIDDTIEMSMININNKNLAIEVNVDTKIVVYADENMITTVIRNLIGNAIKFSQPHKTISIGCKVIKNFIEVSVRDSGIGISKNDQAKLFRIDKHHTTEGTLDEKGTGLGLLLCKEFIEQNGGKIRVESELNKGSSFIFTLPKQAI